MTQSLHGLDVLGVSFDDVKKLPWGDIGRVAGKVGGTVLNVYAPGAGTAVSDLADQGIDAAEGKKRAPRGAPPGPSGAPPSAPGALPLSVDEAVRRAMVERVREDELVRARASAAQSRMIAYAAAGAVGLGVLVFVLAKVLR
mgnify:CR=1 FL=1